MRYGKTVGLGKLQVLLLPSKRLHLVLLQLSVVLSQDTLFKLHCGF